MNAYDVGWIKLSASSGQPSLAMSRSRMTPNKQLRLPSTDIELAAPTFDPDTASTSSFVQLLAERRLILQQPETPTRWICSVQSNSDNWQHYLYIGCPILDLKGRVAGMFGGFNRGIAQSGKLNPNGLVSSVNPSDRIEMVPVETINEVLTLFQQSESP